MAPNDAKWFWSTAGIALIQIQIGGGKLVNDTRIEVKYHFEVKYSSKNCANESTSLFYATPRQWMEKLTEKWKDGQTKLSWVNCGVDLPWDIQKT